MHIVTTDAISVNGKITKGDDADAHTWTSSEDWEHFKKLRDSFDLLVMGSVTYDAVQPKPEAGQLRVILTRNPEAYKDQAISDQLEFVTATPKELVSQLEARGFSRMLLVGGQVNTQFWAAGMVNEAYITIEPKLFGTGKVLASDADFAANLTLQSVKQLNQQGTLLLHYTVDNQAA